jgi:hypothetical protein
MEMRAYIRPILVATLLLVPSASLFAQAAVDPSGHWEGTIQAPARSAAIPTELEGTWNGTLDVNGMQMRIVLTLANQPDGSATGSLANLDQGALEVPIAAITHKGSSVTLDVTAVGGSYSGALNSDVTEMAGTWSQGTLTLPLTLRRARESRIPKSQYQDAERACWYALAFSSDARLRLLEPVDNHVELPAPLRQLGVF